MFHPGPTIASMIHGQILTDSSQLHQPWLLEARLSIKENHVDSGETKLMLTQVQASAGHV